MYKIFFRYQPKFLKKTKKLFKNPGLFFRDYLNNKYPNLYNEIKCTIEEETILLKYDLELETKSKVDDPIDVVFTWVNDKDFIWKEKYLKYKNEKIGSHGQYAVDIARFSNHNELFFSIKSVLINMPWVRNIYVITDNQIPKWVGEYKNIKIIDHKDIIPSKYLPTFNSHVIESYLFKISGLAERFIYFNDDVFVARPLPIGHFFKSENAMSLFLSEKSLHEMVKHKRTPTLSASLKVGEIFKRDFNIDIDTPLVHTYVPLRKSMFEYVWRIYEADISSFLSNKFRTNEDLNLATFMVPWFTFIKGGAIPARDICYYFNIRSPAAKKHYIRLKKVKSTEMCPHSFCANDVTASIDGYDGYQFELISLLRFFYSDKGA